jgi:hypothetical protein
MMHKFHYVLCILLSGFALIFTPIESAAGFMATPEQPSASFESFLQGIGRSLEQTSRRITGRQPYRRATSTSQSRETTLNIQRSTLAPTVVYKGEKVTMTLQYLISGAPEKGITIREKSMLSKDGKVLTVLKDESSQKENGIWENTLSFVVPGSAKSGNYVVSLQLSTQGESQTARHTFTLH